MKRAKDSLQELGVRPSKQRGQNFLIDSTVIDTVIEFGKPAAGKPLVEIGPGLGALTQRLAAIDPALTVVEVQAEFCAELQARYPTVKVINEDVRAIDLSEIGKDLVVFGNLPYSLSTDIVFHIIAFSRSVRRAIFMLQREFCERLAAPPGGRDYGVLSVMVQLHCNVRLGPVIKGNAFHPPAGVDSALVELTILPAPRVQDIDLLWFQRVVRAAFSRRRKKLHNSLCVPGFLASPIVDQGLALSGIDGNRRAETLSIEEFGLLAKALLRASEGAGAV